MQKEGKKGLLGGKCRHYLHLMWLIPSFVVGACGGGGSSGGIVGPDGVFGDLEYNACESTYYQNIIGRFAGTVEYRLDVDNQSLHHCLFTIELEIVGTPDIGPTPDRANRCFLTSSTTGEVEQFVFLPVSQSGATECVATQGSLNISDPNSSVINPEIFYENVVYPVSLGANGPIQENFGPYQGSADQIVQYTYLFGSNNGLSNQLTVDSNGSLEVVLGSQQISESGLVLISNLERSN